MFCQTYTAVYHNNEGGEKSGRDKRQAFYGKEQKGHGTGRRRYTCVLQLSQAREFHGAHTRTKMNCSAVHFEVSVPWPEKSL